MSDDAAARGRLFVVTGGDAGLRIAVARELALRLDQSVAVDGTVFEGMVVSRRVEAAMADPALDRVRDLLLRWSAALATAETYQLEGFDAVVSEDLEGDHLEDFLDLASPETVLLVVLDGDPTRTPRWGLWLPGAGREPADLATEALGQLDEASVPTALP